MFFCQEEEKILLRKNHLCTFCKDHLWTWEDRKGEYEDLSWGLGLGDPGSKRGYWDPNSDFL